MFSRLLRRPASLAVCLTIDLVAMFLAVAFFPGLCIWVDRLVQGRAIALGDILKYLNILANWHTIGIVAACAALLVGMYYVTRGLPPRLEQISSVARAANVWMVGGRVIIIVDDEDLTDPEDENE